MSSEDLAFAAWGRAQAERGYDSDWIRRNYPQALKWYRDTEGQPMPRMPERPTGPAKDRYRELD